MLQAERFARPSTGAGKFQWPDAQSFRRSSAQAKAPRSVQFFELWGNRAITSGRWRAVSLHKPGTDFSGDRWQLFDIEADATESKDLSTVNPAKLSELRKLWEQEAGKVRCRPPRGASVAPVHICGSVLRRPATRTRRFRPGCSSRRWTSWNCGPSSTARRDGASLYPHIGILGRLGSLTSAWLSAISSP
jgi:hypothetical protein